MIIDNFFDKYTQNSIIKNWKNKKILVSVICITYNQDKYIEETIQGFLVQKTLFPFEIIIHDDASTDKTANIIKKYAQKYPCIIKAIYQKENQYSQGISIGKRYLYPMIRGKYFARCEGDDYWCDEYKLQKQVDFMETHPDYALCYHPAKMIYVEEQLEPVIIGTSNHKNPQPYYNLIKANNIPANSIMYKTEYLKQELTDYPANIYPPDWYNHIAVASHGKIGYLPDVMYVYRWHSQGVSHTTTDNPREEIHLKYGVKEVNFSYAVWNKIKEQFPQYYKEVFVPVLKDVYLTYLKALRFEELNILTNKYSQFFKDFELCPENKELNKVKKKYKKYKKLYKLLGLVSITLFIAIVYLAFVHFL